MEEPAPLLVHRVIARLNIGGPAMHVVNLARGLDQGGRFRTRLLAGSITTDEGDMAYYARERGVEVTELPALSRLLSPLADLKILWTLYRIFRREGPAIVHTHTAKAGTLGRLAAILARVPVTIHTFHGHVLGGDYFSPVVTRVFLEVERQLARWTRRIVVLTEGQKEEMTGRLRVAPEERFAVIPLGLELEPFREVDRSEARRETRAALGIEADEVVVGTVGRLVPVKNHELLFEALPPLEEILGRRVRVLVVGSGLREAELRHHAARVGIGERVLWLGWRRDLPRLYPAMDALALTSFDEGTPVAVLEALASGTPVAARAVGGVPEILRGMPRSILVEGDTPGDMARGLARVLTRQEDGEGEEETVEAGHEEAAETLRRAVARRYSVDRLARDMEALYREALEEVGVDVAAASSGARGTGAAAT
jgi:glycosyltransferase involved in cell wall biosynthesis